MDFKELFSGDYIVKVRYRGHPMEHHLRQPTTDEDLEYRRRSAKMNFKSRHLESSDAALQAPIWLYDKCIKKVMIQNGGPEFEEVPSEYIKQQPAQLKLAVVNALLSDIEQEAAEELKN